MRCPALSPAPAPGGPGRLGRANRPLREAESRQFRSRECLRSVRVLTLVEQCHEVFLPHVCVACKGELTKLDAGDRPFLQSSSSGDFDQVNGPQEKARRPLDRKSAGFQSSLRRGKESQLLSLCLQWSGTSARLDVAGQLSLSRVKLSKFSCGWRAKSSFQPANTFRELQWAALRLSEEGSPQVADTHSANALGVPGKPDAPRI
ncbi:uncharacterized protein LOC101678171 [Mustela putorius furo]|uniref:Uncharacterized protein LOC101678171 n=1 Tax=Mustela putorius furo TaxID=9669 RepID=A0A8U0V9L3_MUSPF|nr:uncharacterized protein LOC101678171 [Mustela putorius furo]